MRFKWWWYLLILLFPLVANGQDTVVGRSILVTPHVQLEARVAGDNVTQPRAGVQPVEQPPVYYQPAPRQVSPQVGTDADSVYRMMVFNHMMFNATFQRRGILFPRYVRRPDARARQLIVIGMWK